MATCVIPRHADSRPAAASPEPITLDSCTLDQIEAYYERGLCRQALECAQAYGPLRAWQGTRAQILAGRIALNMGAPRLGRWLHVQAYRHDSRSLEARAYYASYVLERRGPLAAWKLLDRWGEGFAQASSEPHSVQQLLLLQVRVAALLRDFEVAEMWYARAEQLDREEPWLHTEQAFLLEQEDRYEEALAAARHSLEVRPWYRPGVQMTTHLLQVLDRDEEALELLTAASTRLESLSALAQLATLQMDLERFPEACATLERMGQLSPLLEAEYLDWMTMHLVKAARLTQQFGRAAELARKLREPYWQQLAERLSGAGDSCRRVKLPVRFVRQHHMTCAPATLAALSRFWQRPAEHLALAEAICYDGTPAHSERQWAEAHGWRVREFTVTWASAVRLLERGIPFTITTTEAVSAHMQAVIGYDELNGTLLLRDPSHYYTSEVPVGPFLQRYRASGPRGMALVPETQARVFEDIDLPDAALYDQMYGVQRALAEHRRDLAEAVLKQMQTDAPEHRLTLSGQRAIAAYDAHLPAMQRCVEALLQQFPGDANLQLVKLSCLQELSPREERLGWLRSITAQPAVDPVFWQQYAQELRADAREQDTAWLWLRRALRYRPLDTGNLLTLADLLWDQREFSEALQVYRFAACLDDKKEQPARSYFKAAQCLKRTEEALGFLRRRVERFGAKSSLPLRTLFEAYCELNQTQAALAALERGLEQRPEDVDLLVFGAEALARCGLAEPAEALLQRAAGQGKHSAWLRAKALLAEYRGDGQSALALWGEILELEPLQMEAHRAVTRWLAATQGRAGVLRHLEQVCARFPYHFGLHQLWIGWLREESSTEAEKVLQRLLEMNPADAWSHRELALVLGQQARYPDALVQAELALQLEPNHPAGYCAHGHLLLAQGNPAAAKADFRRALALAIDNANYEWSWRALIAWSKEANQPDLASRLIEDLLGHRPGDARLWVLQARTLAESGKPQAALQALESGLAADARCVEAYDLKAQLLTELQRYAAALAACQPTVWKQPPMELRARTAWIDYQRGNVATAIAQLRQALEENPGCAWAWKELAQWYWAWGKTDEAMEAISRVTRLSPLDPVPIAYRAALKRQRQEPAGALEDFQRAWQLEPTYAYAGFNLFELQLESRLFQEAAQTLHILREQVGGDRVTACQVQWHAAKVQHEAAGEAPAAKEPLELLRQLCRIQGEDPSPLETAITALLAAGLGKEVDQVLREAVACPDAHPHVGAQWTRRLSCPRGGKARYPRGMDALCRQGEPGRRAVIELVEVAGEKRQPWLLRRVLWKHRGWLREHPQGREAVARALLRLDNYRKVVSWLADWRARPEVNLQVLHYLAVALRALGREKQAHEVVRVALAQPDPGQQFAILKLWHAVEEALAGNAAGAAEQVKEIQPGGWDDYSKNLYCLTDGVILVQQAPRAQRKEVFRQAGHRIGEQFKQVPLSHCNLAVRREYRRCLWRMASDAGQWWRGIPAVCRTFHWAYLWGIPILFVLLLSFLVGGAGKSAAPVVPVFIPILLVYWALSCRQ